MSNKKVLVMSVLIIVLICFSGCQRYENPLRFMMEYDNNTENETAEGQSNVSQENTQSDSGSNNLKGSKTVILGTYGNVSELVKAEDYRKITNIELAQQTIDNREVSDLITVSGKVSEILSDSATSSLILTCKNANLEEISYFLYLTVKYDKPVIVIPEDMQGYSLDTAIRDAVLVAVNDSSANKGTMILVNGNLYCPRDFSAEVLTGIKNNKGLMGTLSDNSTDNPSVVYNYFSNKKHNSASNFDITSSKDLPYVSILYDYVGNDGSVYEKLEVLSDGIVIVPSTSDGSLSSGVSSIVKDSSKSLPVVVTGTNGENVVSYDYSGNSFSVITTDLSPVKARLLCSLALTKTKDVSSVGVYFKEY